MRLKCNLSSFRSTEHVNFTEDTRKNTNTDKQEVTFNDEL